MEPAHTTQACSRRDSLFIVSFPTRVLGRSI
jgi:hypothetical protein